MRLNARRYSTSKLIILSICSLVLLCLLSAIPAGAVQEFWLNGTEQPSITSSAQQKSAQQWWMLQGCSSQPGKVTGINSIGVRVQVTLTSDLCVVHGKDFSLASFMSSDSGFGRGGIAIRVGGDSEYYTLSLSVDQKPILVNGTNTLQYLSDHNGSSWHKPVVDSEFPERLKRRVEGTMYRIDTSIEPDYKLVAQNGAPLTGEAAAHSRDGRYWVFSGANGVIFADALAGVTRLISADKRQSYSTSFMQLAVADDGKYVAVGGTLVAANRIYYRDLCGDEIPNNDTHSRYVMQNPCGFYDFGTQLRAQFGDESVYNSYFFGYNAGELYLQYSTTDRHEANQTAIRITSPGYTPPQLDYLALGDSYSSGEGDTETDPATDEKYYREFTDEDVNVVIGQPEEKCHLSTRSYPYLLAGSMNLTFENPKKWDSVACSGATMWDVSAKGSSTYKGQWARLKDFDVDALKTVALDEFIPGRQKQIEFVRKYKPKAITITMGGNDVGFGEKIIACATPFPLTADVTCDYAESNGRADLGNSISRLYKNLQKLYSEMHNASPKTKLYIIGYPQFINGENLTCGDLNTGGINFSEREMISQSISYTNKVIRQVSRFTGVKYIDIENSLLSHRLCDEEDKYVTGITNVLGLNENEKQESFHPNAKGHNVIYAAIKNALHNESLLDYDNCPETDIVICPDTSATEDNIEVPEYFQTDFATTENVEYKHMTTFEVAKETQTLVSLEAYAFAPSGSVSLELHSDPINLGTATAKSNGGLEFNIAIPADTPVGYHTLELHGATFSGEPIVFEQVILVKSNNTEDIDEDGVLDTIDPCLFIEPANIDSDMDGQDDACDPEITKPKLPYRARMGDPLRTYNNGPELQNYIYIERNTRLPSITGIENDYDPDGDGWAVVGASQGVVDTTGTPRTVPDNGPIANFAIEEGTTPRPFAYTRTANYGCVAFTPTKLSTIAPGENRTLKRTSVNSDKCRSAPLYEDSDINGEPDNTQTLYIARNGNPSFGEDFSRLYLFRNHYSAEAQLGISDYSPTGTAAGIFAQSLQPIQVWNLLASTQTSTSAIFSKLVILSNSIGVPTPIVLAKDSSGICSAYQPQSIDVIRQKDQLSRKLIRLTVVPEGVNCE